MTLIALATKPHPALLGDLLITGGPRRSLDALPSLGDISNLPKPFRQLPLHSMVRKVALLSPTVAVAWSGRLVIARRTLTDLRNHISTLSKSPSADDILAYLAQLEYNDWKSFSLLGMESLKNSYFFCSSISHRRYNKYGDVLAEGSGSAALFSYLDKTDQSHPINEAPLLVAGLQSLTSEFFNIGNLKQGYGGGYEFLYSSYGRMHAVDNFVYVIWFLGSIADVLKDFSLHRMITFEWPGVVIKNTYAGDVLISIRTMLEKNTYRGKIWARVVASSSLVRRRRRLCDRIKWELRSILMLSTEPT